LWQGGTDAQNQAVSAIIRLSNVDPRVFKALISVESAGKPDAVSSAGAIGLSQLMEPTAQWTAKRMGIEYYKGIEYNPEMNVRLGLAYLEYLLGRYGGDYTRALTAYNRGPRNTDIILSKYGEIPQSVKDFYSDKILRKAGWL